MNVTVGSYTGMGREEIKREREQIPSYVAVFSLEKKKIGATSKMQDGKNYQRY